MCFGGKPRSAPAMKTPQITVPQPEPIQNKTPKTSTGADEENKQQMALNKSRRKSLFQIDLQVPQSGPSAGGNNQASSPQAGPSV